MEQLREIMTPNVVTIEESQSVQEAAALMEKYHIGSIPVVNEQRQMVGILTDRDITLRSTAKGQTPNLSVSQVMSFNQIVSAPPHMEIEQAAQLMSDNQIRRLPVVENGYLVGMVALGDLAIQQHHDQKAGQALRSISNPTTLENNL